MATGQVTTDQDDIIVFVPPIWHKFKGQKLENLIQWLLRKSSSGIEKINLEELGRNE